jgi:hypothetical protein
MATQYNGRICTDCSAALIVLLVLIVLLELRFLKSGQKLQSKHDHCVELFIHENRNSCHAKLQLVDLFVDK